jgi:predicted RecB family nuclease
MEPAMSQNMLSLSPSHFFQFDTQPLWIWYDHYGDIAKKEEVSDFALKIMEDGVLHEEKIISAMNIIEVKSRKPKEALKETLELMKKGEPLIYQGWIEAKIEGVMLCGRPDLLERREGESNFGKWHYVPVDIKSSSKIKTPQRNQMILYGWILKVLQGYLPETFEIINRNCERLSEPISRKHFDKAQEVKHKILSIMNGSKPELTISSKAKNSPWFKESVREAESLNDISLIYRLDPRALGKLRALGINTLDDIVKTDISTLPKIPYAPPSTLQKAQLQAKCLIDNSPNWIGSVGELPQEQLKLYFDIEGDPWLGVEYLFGFWVVGDPKGKLKRFGEVRSSESVDGKYFLYFLAKAQEDESKLWANFLSWLDLLPQDLVVYHYADYERSRLNSMKDRYEGSDSLIHFLSKLVDLQKVVNNSVVLPLYFYSIKDICKSKFVNFQWRHEKAGGGQSIFWYEEWLEKGKEEVLQDIINYNEDDVRATEHLHLWLEQNSP